MKTFDEQLLKFQITNNKLKMEISLKDLAWLFENSPDNFDGDKPCAVVRRGKRQEFAEYMVRMLLDDAPNERDCTRWGEPFDDIFDEILSGAEDEFIEYLDGEEDCE